MKVNVQVKYSKKKGTTSVNTLVNSFEGFQSFWCTTGSHCLIVLMQRKANAL
jgi:hypothetical protein